MKFFRFLALVVISGMPLVSAFAQTSPSSGVQSPSASQPPALPQSSPQPATGFIRNPFVQPGSRPSVQVQKSRNDLRFIDKGIYAKNPSSSCGTIVSYNFSQGNNPQLENVTTCTPGDLATFRTADGKLQKPAQPALPLRK